MNINNMDTGKYVLSLGDIVGTKVMANYDAKEQSQFTYPKAQTGTTITPKQKKHKLNNLDNRRTRSTRSKRRTN